MSGGLTKILNTKTYEPINYRPFPIGRYGVKVGERPIYGIPYLRNADMKPVDSRISNTPRLGQTSGLPDRRPTTQSGEGHCGQMCKCEVPMRGGPNSSVGGGIAGADDDKCQQCGGNIFKDIKKGVAKVGKAVGKAVKGSAKKIKGVAKVVKGVSRVVEGVASTGATIAAALGQPEIAAPLAAVAGVAKGVEEGAKQVQKKARTAQQKSRKIQQESRKMEQEGGVHNPCKKFPGSKDCLSYMKGVRQGRIYLRGGEDEPAVNRFGITPGPRGNEKSSFVATHPMNYRKARLASLIRV